MNPLDRIGTPYIPVDPKKIRFIVESTVPDRETRQISADGLSRRIGKKIDSGKRLEEKKDG